MFLDLICQLDFRALCHVYKTTKSYFVKAPLYSILSTTPRGMYVHVRDLVVKILNNVIVCSAGPYINHVDS